MSVQSTWSLQGRAGRGWCGQSFSFPPTWDVQFSEAEAHAVILDELYDCAMLTPVLAAHLPRQTSYQGHSAAVALLDDRDSCHGDGPELWARSPWDSVFSDCGGCSPQRGGGLIATSPLSFPPRPRHPWKFCLGGLWPGKDSLSIETLMAESEQHDWSVHPKKLYI